MKTTIALLTVVLTACGGGGREGDTSTDTPGDQPDTVTDSIGDDPATEAGCSGDLDCDDSDPCTVDVCDLDFGSCVHEAEDADGDGYPASTVDGSECGGTDCDDEDDGIHPDADPGCEPTDDRDCDGLPDPDEDGDGHVTEACSGDDCDDSDPDAYPGSTVIECTDADRDCNGHPDHDQDGDGHLALECDGNDCDDTNPDVHWGAVEIPCDGLDDDCDFDLHATEDADGDGHANADCLAPGHEVDCDDHDNDIHPGATEICDMIDQDCDGTWADGGADDDGDGFLDASCDGGDDCDDTRADTFPGAAEVCEDGIDQDCDGSADGLGPTIPDVRISDDTPAAIDPTIAWSGSEFGILWDDSPGGVRFGRVAASGVPVASSVQVDTNGSAEGPLTLVWTGSGYSAFWWKRGAMGIDQYMHAPLSGDGSTIGSSTLVAEIFTMFVFGLAEASVAWTGSELGIVYGDSTAVSFVRLSPSGAFLSSALDVSQDTTSGVTNDRATVAWTGSEYGVVWTWAFDDIFTPDYELRFARVQPDGSAATSPYTAEDGGWSSEWMRWTGSEYRVGYQAWNGYMLKRLDGDGVLLGSEVPGVPSTIGACGEMALTWSGTATFVAWYDMSAATGDIWVNGLFEPFVVMGPDVRVTTETSESQSPTLAWTGSVLGVAWEDQRDGAEEIYFTLVEFCE